MLCIHAVSVEKATFASWQKAMAINKHQKVIMGPSHNSSVRYLLMLAFAASVHMILLSGKIPVEDANLNSAMIFGNNTISKFNSTMAWNVKENHCQFLKESEMYRPVLLMAMGRSGSSVTWDTLSRLTGTPNKAYEVTGSNEAQANVFFQTRIPDHVGSKWALRRMCEIQYRYSQIYQTPQTGIVGFQWKPFLSTWMHEYAQGALKDIAQHNQQYENHHKIRILYLSRNPLDKLISNLRHRVTNQTLPAHCGVNETQCLKQFAKTQKGGVELPVGPVLVTKLQQSQNQQLRVQKRLKELFGRLYYQSVTYESLYEESNEKACLKTWKRVLKFLGFPSRARNMTSMNDITKQFSMAKTHGGNSRRKRISNYDAVAKSLKGTNFAYLAPL